MDSEMLKRVCVSSCGCQGGWKGCGWGRGGSVCWGWSCLRKEERTGVLGVGGEDVCVLICVSVRVCSSLVSTGCTIIKNIN